MPGLKRISAKENGFCVKFIETGNATQAAVDSYNVKSRPSASVIGHDLLHKPRIKAEIERIIAEKKLSPELVIDRLRQGLEAKVVTSYMGEANQTDIPDLNTRHKYVETGAKILDLFPPERSESRSLNIDIQVEKMSPGEVGEVLKKLMAENDELLKKTDSKEIPGPAGGSDN